MKTTDKMERSNKMYKVYSGWAFSENENEKAESNRQTYKEICKKWRVKFIGWGGEKINSNDYDLILNRTAGYNHSIYHIFKNETDLSQDELALVCDEGNLCFGYTMEGKDFYVFED